MIQAQCSHRYEVLHNKMLKGLPLRAATRTMTIWAYLTLLDSGVFSSLFRGNLIFPHMDSCCQLDIDRDGYKRHDEPRRSQSFTNATAKMGLWITNINQHPTILHKFLYVAFSYFGALDSSKYQLLIRWCIRHCLLLGFVRRRRTGHAQEGLVLSPHLGWWHGPCKKPFSHHEQWRVQALFLHSFIH